MCGWTYLSKQHPLWLQVQTHSMTLVVQEVLQPQELDSAEGTPVAPVHRDFQLSRLRDRTRSAAAANIYLEQSGPASSAGGDQRQMCVTRSSSSVNFWSQAWLLTGFQLVCPTTVLSSFRTALISSGKNTLSCQVVSNKATVVISLGFIINSLYKLLNIIFFVNNQTFFRGAPIIDL